MPSGVARDEGAAFDFRVRADVEVWQRRSPGATAAPIFQKRLRRNPTGPVRHRQSLKHGGIEPAIKIGGGGERGREFGVDDGVDGNRALRNCSAKLLLRPREPDWIGGGDVQQDVRVEENHSSPRVSFITSCVFVPEIAAPRARCNQHSTGGGVARR